MVITFEDLELGDEDLAREVLVLALSIAPCLDSLVDEPRENALAILRRVARDAPAAGEGRLRSMSRNGTSIGIDTSAPLFDLRARAGLAALCPAAREGGLPRGSFPQGRPFGRLWPEEPYS